MDLRKAKHLALVLLNIKASPSRIQICNGAGLLAFLGWLDVLLAVGLRVSSEELLVQLVPVAEVVVVEVMREARLEELAEQSLIEVAEALLRRDVDVIVLLVHDVDGQLLILKDLLQVAEVKLHALL